MQRIIQQITQQLLDRLPENDQYYRLDELRSRDFPSFITARIKIELERNLAESMIIPKTDWANTQSDAVLDAWQKFVDAIRAEARLPASYGKTVIETAVADVIEMLVQPRKNISSVIFGAEEELNADEIQDRLKAVVVYPHFNRLIQRYMEKKGLDRLSKERCDKVIAEADEKLVSGYSPLNWAQMLEPLFRLLNGEIDTDLLRLFYEDKNMPRIARKFDLMNDTLSRAEFIEVLSSPELLDFEGYEDEQSSLFDTEQQQTVVSETEQKSEPKEQSTAESEEVDDETESDNEPVPEKNSDKTEPQENKSDPDLPNRDQISALLFPDEKFREQLQEGETLNKNYALFDEQAPEVDDIEEGTINAVFRDQDEQGSRDNSEKEKPEIQDEKSKTSDSDQATSRETVEQSEKKDESQQNGQEKASENEKNETPIWMRYMSEEEVEEFEKEQAARKETDEDGFIEEPIIDLTQEDASDKEIEDLRKLLKPDRELFVEEIFRGSDRAYVEAVEEIAAYNSWRDVSSYIEKEIFKRNLVDMYSEAAVDFTDCLQSYFLEKQNQNK